MHVENRTRSWRKKLVLSVMALSFAILGGFVAAVLSSLVLFMGLGLWFDLYVYSTTAFFFVLTGGMLSSLNKPATAISLAVIAILAALDQVGESIDPTTYMPTYLPLLSICIASVVAALTVMFCRWLRERQANE